jgi:DNA-binding HxlR family transcriptional regulator
MYRYGQYCPVARAAEIVADRWTVLIVRELLADVNHFNELERGLPHISRALLVERLKRLERTGVLERRVLSNGKQTEYRLTAAGRELQKLIDTLGEWGARWSFGEPRPDELDPSILLWWMRRRVALDSIPQRRTVIEFDLRSARKQRYWLLLEPTEVSVCLKHPGFDVDVIVSADIMALYKVWLGRTTLAEALYKKQVLLEGSPADLRAFPQWFTWSPMAGSVRAAMADRQREGVAIKPSSPRNKRMSA